MSREDDAACCRHVGETLVDAQRELLQAFEQTLPHEAPWTPSGASGRSCPVLGLAGRREDRLGETIRTRGRARRAAARRTRPLSLGTAPSPNRRSSTHARHAPSIGTTLRPSGRASRDPASAVSPGRTEHGKARRRSYSDHVIRRPGLFEHAVRTRTMTARSALAPCRGSPQGRTTSPRRSGPRSVATEADGRSRRGRRRGPSRGRVTAAPE